MVLGYVAGIALLILSLFISWILSMRQSRYWLAAIFCLMFIILIGFNSLILNTAGLKISDTNLLAIFGLESFLGLMVFIYLLFKGRHKFGFLNLLKRPLNRENKNKGIVFLVAILFIIAIPLSLGNQNKQGYTEFYLKESEYSSPGWSKTYSYSDHIPIHLVVNNQELDSTEYDLTVLANGSGILSIDLGRINSGQSLTTEIDLPPSGEPIVNYQFLLYKVNGSSPYRFLSIWIKRGSK